MTERGAAKCRNVQTVEIWRIRGKPKMAQNVFGISVRFVRKKTYECHESS
jgi:hypothetical protein